VQVRSSPPSLPVAVDYRRERVGDAAGGRVDEGVEVAPRRDATRIDVSRIRAERLATESLADLPARSRGAMSAYLSNGPTLSERYGVELAGIDLFV
jgi:hypothetical protein